MAILVDHGLIAEIQAIHRLQPGRHVLRQAEIEIWY
jgi:hypothetical protein